MKLNYIIGSLDLGLTRENEEMANVYSLIKQL
jgi:hypothetical protein